MKPLPPSNKQKKDFFEINKRIIEKKKKKENRLNNSKNLTLVRYQTYFFDTILFVWFTSHFLIPVTLITFFFLIGILGYTASIKTFLGGIALYFVYEEVVGDLYNIFRGRNK